MCIRDRAKLTTKLVDVFHNGEKVYVVPVNLSKGMAVRRLRKRLQPCLLYTSLFGNFRKQLDKILAKYHTMGEEVDKIYVQLKRSEEHTSELQSPEAISYAVFCLKKIIRRQFRVLQT